MIFPVALYYLVVIPLFLAGDGAETTPLTFVVAFLAVFVASAWVECHVIGDLPFAGFVAKLAFVVAAAAALLFSTATAVQLQDVALAVFALESASALVTAFYHVLVEYQQVFVVDDEPSTMSAEPATFASPPVVAPVTSHNAVTPTTSQAVASHSTATFVSSPPPEIPFDAERFLMRVHLQYQLEAEAAKQRIHSLLQGIYVERIQNHVTPVSFPVTTAPPGVTDQPQGIATTIAPPPPPPSSPPTTSATPSPAAGTTSPSCAIPTPTEDILPVDIPVAQLVDEDYTLTIASTEPSLAQLSLAELVSDDAGHDALDLLPTQPMGPSVESQDPPSASLPINSPTARPHRNVRHVKSKRERTCPTPPATYATRSGRSVGPPDRLKVVVQSPCVDVSCYTTRSGRHVRPPSRFTAEVFGSSRH